MPNIFLTIVLFYIYYDVIFSVAFTPTADSTTRQNESKHFLCLETEKCVHHLLTEFIFYSKISYNLPFILHIPKLFVFRSVWYFIKQCDCLFAMCH